MGVTIGGVRHEELADPGGGSYASVADYNAAAGPAATQGGQNLNWGTSSTTAKTGMTAPTTTGTGAEQYGAAIQKALDALASGNREAFQRAIYEWDQTFGLDKEKFAQDVAQFNQTFGLQQAGVTGTYQGAPTQAAQLQRANIAAQQAGLTGYYQNPFGLTGGAPSVPAVSPSAFAQQDAATQALYNQYHGANAAVDWARDATAAVQQASAAASPGGGQGVPTMQLQAQNAGLYGVNGVPTAGQQTLAAQAQNAGLYGYNPTLGANGVPMGANGQPLTTLAAQNQAYTQQMGMINQAATLQANPFRQQQAIGQMSGLLGGGGVASFQAPNTVQGVGTAGGNQAGGMGYLQQMIDDIRNPSANQTSMSQVLQGIPTPNKLNSVEFQRAAPSTQSMVLQGMQEKYGLDPADALKQIQATLPAFTAPTTMGTVKR